VQSLIESLFALVVTTPARGLAPSVRHLIVHADADTWQRAVAALTPHKLFPLLSYRLREHDLLASVPAAVQRTLSAMHDEVRSRNALLMLTLARILRLTASRGEPVLLLKGILLADSFYPDFSTRPMADIDILSVRGRDEQLFSLLGELGFRPSLHHTVQCHSITFMNREGVFCDAHRSLPILESVPWHRVWTEVELTRVHGVKVLALEPNLMVAHLVRHMYGHSHELGFVLLWVIDLLFVLRRYEGQLDFTRVRKLLASDAAWAFLLRATHLLASAGEPIPPALAKSARMVPPLTLGTVLRQRRITPWGLPHALGWARLAAHQLGLHRSQRPLPLLPDLVLWPLDELAEYVAPPLARASQR
jgi:hypothetical protein